MFSILELVRFLIAGSSLDSSDEKVWMKTSLRRRNWLFFLFPKKGWRREAPLPPFFHIHIIISEGPVFLLTSERIVLGILFLSYIKKFVSFLIFNPFCHDKQVFNSQANGVKTRRNISAFLICYQHIIICNSVSDPDPNGSAQ